MIESGYVLKTYEDQANGYGGRGLFPFWRDQSDCHMISACSWPRNDAYMVEDAQAELKFRREYDKQRRVDINL